MLGLGLLGSAAPVMAEEVLEEKSNVIEINNVPQPQNVQPVEFATVYIKDIEILGSNIIRPESIKNVMQLKTGDVYDEELLQQDLSKIFDMGYFTDNMKAIPVRAHDDTVTLKILLEENIPVTDFTIEGNTVISTEELMPYLLPLKGKPQNIASINEAIEKINDKYYSKGYILARIDSFYDDPDGVLNLHINEGRINKIMIVGNEKTKDYVVERNIMTEPGTVYNENLVKQDLVKLYSTQSFKDVNRQVDVCEDNPDLYDVTIVLKEQRTASVSVGGGIDSATGVFGSLGIADNNFRGLNQRVSLSGMIGSGVLMSDASIKRHANFQAELSFFEPYFLNADTSLMSRIFFRDLGSYQVPLAIEQRFGIESTAIHRMKCNEHLQSTFALGLEHINLKEGDSQRIANMYAANHIPISERAKELSDGLFFHITPGLMYDSRDTNMNPRSGVLASLRFEEALGVADFEKTNGRLTGMARKYIPVLKKSALSFTAKGGIKVHGDEMPEVMAYKLGGPYSIRGFKINGVGTGESFIMGSAELTTPIPFFDRLRFKFFDNIRLAFFVDAGKIFDPTISSTLYDRPLYAVTAGVGLKVYVPGVGPMSIDYGIPLTDVGEYGSSNGYFTFGVGDMLY